VVLYVDDVINAASVDFVAGRAKAHSRHGIVVLELVHGVAQARVMQLPGSAAQDKLIGAQL